MPRDVLRAGVTAPSDVPQAPAPVAHAMPVQCRAAGPRTGVKPRPRVCHRRSYRRWCLGFRSIACCEKRCENESADVWAPEASSCLAVCVRNCAYAVDRRGRCGEVPKGRPTRAAASVSSGQRTIQRWSRSARACAADASSRHDPGAANAARTQATISSSVFQLGTSASGKYARRSGLACATWNPPAKATSSRRTLTIGTASSSQSPVVTTTPAVR